MLVELTFVPDAFVKVRPDANIFVLVMLAPLRLVKEMLVEVALPPLRLVKARPDEKRLVDVALVRIVPDRLVNPVITRFVEVILLPLTFVNEKFVDVLLINTVDVAKKLVVVTDPTKSPPVIYEFEFPYTDNAPLVYIPLRPTLRPLVM